MTYRSVCVFLITLVIFYLEASANSSVFIFGTAFFFVIIV